MADQCSSCEMVNPNTHNDFLRRKWMEDHVCAINSQSDLDKIMHKGEDAGFSKQQIRFILDLIQSKGE